MLLVDMVQGRVLGRAKGCPEDEAIDAMRDACIEFCKETYFLTGGLTVETSGNDVPADFGMDRQVVDVIEARVEGETDPLPVYPMNDPRIDDLCDGEHAIVFADLNELQLVPAATAEAPVRLELLLAIAPGPATTEVPDSLWLRNHEALKDGCLGRLLAMPGEAWSNDEKASYHLGRFAEAMKKTAVECGRNRLTTSRRLRVKPV